MANNPTVVIGSLNDEELKKSIDKLVNHVDQQLNYMVSSTKVAVMSMNKSLKSLGDTKIDFGGSADGGASKRTKAQNAETVAVKESTQAYKEKTLTFGQQASAMNTAIQSSQRYTEEIRKQLAAITSKKDATKAFEQISLMPSNTMDEIKAKGQALVELVKKVKDTPLMSQSNVKLAEKMIGSLANQYRALKEEKEKVANTPTTNVATENTTRRSLEQEKQDLERLKALQEERRQQIIQTGIAAQQQARILRESIGQQMQSADYTKQVDKVKELQNALTEMKNAYKQPIDSSIKKSLEEDIAITQKALDIAKRYNMTVAGLGAVGIGGKAPTDTLAAYSAEAQRLAGIYKNLSTEERSASAGLGLKRKYQELSHTASQVRKELERPINLKDAMKGGESTIDDLAYKIQRLQSYKRGLDFKTQAGEIQEVDNKIKSLNAELNKYLGTAKNVQSQNTALGRSWNYMKNRLAFYFTVGASTQFIKNLIEVRSQYEMNERALGILVNSAERGTQIFNELSQMALVSPYTLIELSAAAKQLTAYDVAAKDVVDTTRRLADMASAVGIPIERLTYALGQIKAYGYLNSRDARMFANAGIPLVKQLADYYTELEGKLVSTADIYDRIKKKAIGYNDVMSVMYKMTDEGGKFFDFQAKMADTLKVRLANLTLAWNNMLNDMGKESQGVLTWGIGALRELFLQWRTFDKTLKEAAGAFGLYKAIQLIILGLQTATKSTLGLNARLTATGVLGTRLVTIFKALGSAMKSLAANWWLVLIAAAVELSSAIINANEATKEFNKSMREGAESTANDLKKYIEQYKDLRDSLYKTQTQTLPNGKTKSTLVPQDIDKNEASKAWEAMREQIELSSAASTDFVSRLLQIENVSDRLREGFKIIDDITQVNAALKDMGDEALVVTQKWSAWWNAWQAPDGLFTNLKEFKVELDEIRQKYGDIENARYVAKHGDINRAANEQDAIMRAASKAVNDYDREMNRFRVDLDKYTSSLDNFANAMEFSSNPTQVAELYAKAVKQLVTQGQLNPQEAFDLQLQIEEARTNAMKLALQSRIADEESALKLAQDERTKESLNASIESNKAQLKLFENSTYEQTAYWNDFTKYIKERHISELTAAYNAMTDNGKKEMDFQSVEWQNYVHKWANSYEKSHNLATDSVFNRIKNWINDANTWSIFIKMTISTEDKKSVYKELGEWDKAADDAYKTMQRLDKEISRLRKKGAKEVVSADNALVTNASADDKKLTQAIEERTQAQKDYNEAVANGGESKKKDAAGSKAQKAAESELAKALKDELSTIDKVRSIYKDLTKDGMSHANAVERATKGWDETVNAINRVLQKNGLKKLNLADFVGIDNPREILKTLQAQLDELVKRGAKPAEIKELQTKIQTLSVDADKYDLTKITKGLNSELGKLKEEYELAVELDANPELGDMFADYFGINLKELPKDYEQALRIAQNRINTMLKENPDVGIASVDIDKLMSRSEFDSWVKSLGKDASSELIKSLTNVRSWLYKVRSDETKKQIQEWDKMLEKYAEYEHKKKQITEEYEKETAAALKMGANASILKAIENRRDTRYAELDFSEFMKTPEWVTATGNLAGMSKTALDMLIDRINKYKNTAKYLSPKQIKELNKALKQLHAEQKKNNPFKAISNMLAEAKERMQNFDKEIEDVNKEIGETETAIKAAATAGQDTSKQTEALEKLKERLSDLNKAKKEVGKFDASEWVGAINETVTAVQAAVGVFNDLAKAIGGINSNDIDKVFGVLEKAGSSAAIGASIGGGYGAVVGAVVGAATSIISWIAGASNERITAKIQDSERAVKRLENAMLDLEDAANHAYGAMTSGAKRAIIANKELQLAELKRQIQLEKSRDSKDVDESKIIELEGQYKQMLLEIKNGIEDVVNEMLGISSAGDAITQLVETMVEAFRNGEDAMEAFGKKWDEMIDSMILKLIVSEYMKKAWDKVMENLKKKEEEFLSKSANDKAWAQNELYKYENMDDLERGYEYAKATGRTKDFLLFSNRLISEANSYMESLRRQVAAAEEAGEKASGDFLEWSLDYMMGEGRDYMTQVGKNLADALGEWYTFGQDKDGALSALQQGISQISETTANALEAYMNSINQQVYYHSSLLEQIRDSVVGLDLDVSLGVQSQMLLQLQNSYQTQQAIQQILEGVLVPSGRAFAVELMS